MKKTLACALFALVFVGCVTHQSRPMPWSESRESVEPVAPGKVIKKSSSSSVSTVKTSIVVDQKDLQTLEKMNKALEDFVLKSEAKAFSSLCKDKRFDCYVDDKIYPKKKKKMARKVPPYASGSKMGLQGEKRIQGRYDFYP